MTDRPYFGKEIKVRRDFCPQKLVEPVLKGIKVTQRLRGFSCSAVWWSTYFETLRLGSVCFVERHLSARYMRTKFRRRAKSKRR